jgi:hypothetical protein
MNAAAIRAAYARTLKENIVVRQYTGAGANRPRFDTMVRGKARQYSSTELIGTIAQGDLNILILVEDLIAQQFSLPLTTDHKIVVAHHPELSIQGVAERKALDGTLIAYEIQARGG